MSRPSELRHGNIYLRVLKCQVQALPAGFASSCHDIVAFVFSVLSLFLSFLFLVFFAIPMKQKVNIHIKSVVDLFFTYLILLSVL